MQNHADMNAAASPAPTPATASPARPAVRFRGQHYTLPSITLFSLLLEFAIILAFAFNVTTLYREIDPAKKLYGGEAEWLTSSVYYARQSLQEYGRISYWQPYLAFGEPLVDNPFSFVLNPVSLAPVLALGGPAGIRFSVFLYALVAGYGGWALGRVMGFGWIGRLLLAGLLIGKGNMVAMIGQGYYQLGVTQAYLPWVIAGAVAVLRLQKRRWPIVLTAVAFTLMFWGGNIWYTLPALIMMAALTATHILDLRKDGNGTRRLKVDTLGLRRMVITAIFTAGLAMVTLLPIFAHQTRIANHPNEKDAGTVVELGKILKEFVDGDINRYYINITAPGAVEFYFSYITPLWFLIVLFIGLPPIFGWSFRRPQPRYWRLWTVVLAMTVFTTIWGAGGNPIMIFLYQNAPLIGQWRFVGRALGMATFCLAILLAMRVDGLWRAVVVEGHLIRRVLSRATPLQVPARLLLGLGIAGISYAAVSSVNQNWKVIRGDGYTDTANQVCITWLRRQFPDRPLSVYGPGYFAVTTYLDNRVRLFNIAADFRMIPDPATVYEGDLTRVLPEFGMGWEENLRAYFRENNFVNLQDSPQPSDPNHCMWQNPNAFPYAFRMPTAQLVAVKPNELKPEMVTPITSFERVADNIGLIVQADPKGETIVSIQETTYPGWSVRVDDQPVKLESVGGQLGVRLAPSEKQHFIHFRFTPDLLFVGGGITLVTWLLCVLYLLRADRFIPERTLKQIETATGTAATSAARVIFNPNLFRPKDPDTDAEETYLLPSTTPDRVIEAAPNVPASKTIPLPPDSDEVLHAEIIDEGVPLKPTSPPRPAVLADPTDDATDADG